MSGAETGAELVRLLGGWLEGTDITLLELRTDAETVRLVRSGGEPSAVPVTAEGVSPAMAVASPGAGVFLDRHPLRTEKLTAPGQAVRAGDVIGLLRVGTLLLHVVAPADGTVADVVAPVGGMVGYGATLLRLERSGVA